LEDTQTGVRVKSDIYKAVKARALAERMTLKALTEQAYLDYLARPLPEGKAA
jgi:hypothetical protein